MQRRPSAWARSRDDLGDVESRQRERLTRQLERDVRGVVGTHEEVAARVGKALGRAGEIAAHGREVVSLVVLERGTHREDGQRDFGVLVRAESAARVAHHLEVAEGRAVGAVSEDPYVAHTV